MDAFGHLAEYVGYVLAAAAIYFLRRFHIAIKRKLDSINDAVNSKPKNQPKLYDIAQSSDVKLDAAVKVAQEARAETLQARRETRDSLGRLERKMDYGFGELHRRLSGQDDRINALDDRSGENTIRIERVQDDVHRRITQELRARRQREQKKPRPSET